MLPLSLPHDSNPLLNWRATRLKVLMVPLVHGTSVPTVPTGIPYVFRERNLLALPTLDMYLPLSKFESIH